ncbi:ABC transporter substrate-binding protein [Caldimonas tepidiphila]|uniref:cytochrome c/ABC transporter substrate-binding protein n=1 Tax=Caldimonas tepidiphila TaxID=2315841 RepID=UPI000E5B47A9|nr:ABC transporter substrate-binding protein [Caldimonas tepidiphila]
MPARVRPTRPPAAPCARRRPLPGRIAALALAAACLAAQAAPPDASELAGRRLYRDGITAAGSPVQALVGPGAARVSGAAVACANCHGRDGLGRPEAGLAPPALRWAELSRPHGHVHGDGRRHPPFTTQTLERALTRGIDPAGRPLDPAMPRFLLAREDLANLVAYLKRLDGERDPGIAEDRLRIGTLLPATGPLAAAARAVRQVLEAGFDELNRAGGLHGRRLELVVSDAQPQAGLERLFEQDVLALLSPLGAGLDEALAALAEAREVPVIGPFAPGARPAAAAGRHTFRLFAGPLEQARVLAAFSARLEKPPHAGAALLLPADAGARAVAQAIAEECAALGCGEIERSEYAPGRFDAAAAVQALRERGRGPVFFLGGNEELAAFVREAARAAWHPPLLLPGLAAARAAAEAPAGFDGRIFLAVPHLPADAAAPSGGFDALRRRHGIGEAQLGAQISAYASVQLLAEGLRRSGRALSREKLLAALESVHGLPTGVGPPLSYGPQRRIGSQGGFVVALDAAQRGFRPASDWIALE